MESSSLYKISVRNKIKRNDNIPSLLPHSEILERMLGTWDTVYGGGVYEEPITIRADWTGTRVEKDKRLDFTLEESDEKKVFPPKEGWIKIKDYKKAGAKTWGYIRTTSGELIVHVFKQRETKKFENIPQYWTGGKGGKSLIIFFFLCHISSFLFSLNSW